MIQKDKIRLGDKLLLVFIIIFTLFVIITKSYKYQSDSHKKEFYNKVEYFKVDGKTFENNKGLTLPKIKISTFDVNDIKLKSGWTNNLTHCEYEELSVGKFYQKEGHYYLITKIY